MERDLQVKIRETPDMLKKEMEVRVLTDKVEAAKARLDTIADNVKAGRAAIAEKGYGKLLAELADDSQAAAAELSLAAIAKQNSQRIVQDNLSKVLLDNKVDAKIITEVDATGKLISTREFAAGADIVNGQASALTFAVNQQREAIGKLITERTQLIKHFELDGGGRQVLAEGSNVTATKDGISYTFTGNDAYAREAAVEMQMKTGSYEEIEALIALSGGEDNKPMTIMKSGKPVTVMGGRSMSQTIADAIFANGLQNKGLFFGGRYINNVARGDVAGEAGLNFGVTMSFVDGKIKAEDIANNDAGAIKRYFAVAEAAKRGNFEPYVGSDPARQRQMLANIEAFKKTAAQILDENSDIGKNAAQSTKDELRKVRDLL
jgi:hypothetical protein